MNIFNSFREKVEARIAALQTEGELPLEIPVHAITVEPPRDPAHGDMSTNAAMVLAKPAGRKPRDLAELLAEGLREDPAVAEVDIAGPGFINFRLNHSIYVDVLREVLRLGEDYGASQLGKAEPVNVEYVSANPTGPMHVGHCRGAVFGDALCALLEKAGYLVTREYYINDAGAQIDVLARSAYLRYLEARGETISIPEGLYPGDYLIPVGEAISERDGDRWVDVDETDWMEYFRQEATSVMMDLIRDDLAALGIRHDEFFSELRLHEDGLIDASIKELEEKGLIYTGVLEPPKGKKPEDWEARPQTLFKASEFGDDVDRPLRKSDGSPTYFAADIAYHSDKIERGFKEMIDVWGADHGGYVKRMQAAIKALSDDEARLDVKLCQMVRLFRGGEPVKMSKRAGSFVTLRDVVDEVGKDVVRFIMLTRKNDAPLDFDFTRVVEQSRDNPVFYVQYAHARICSVFRNARAELSALKLDKASLGAANLERLSDVAEQEILQKLADWPRTVESAAIAHEPHRIAFYLYELASSFHSYWNKGKDDDSLRFLRPDDEELSLARLALIEAVRLVIASGLDVMGVEPVEEMH